MTEHVDPRAGLSRRDFIGGAGLTLALTVMPDPAALLDEAPAGTALANVPLSPNLWVTIATDGTITIVSPAAEMGQGTFTTLPAVLADELDADWARVKPVFPPEWSEKKFGNPGYENYAFQTSASFATRGYFKAMRVAGAQARRVLIDAVAAKWGVPAAELSTEPSVVVHAATGRRISYGEIAAFAGTPPELPRIEDSDLKKPADFRYIGKDLPRVEVPLKVTGAAKYGIDAKVPGMAYAAVLQSPWSGGSPQTVDDEKARQVPGVTDIVRLPEGVGVVGRSVEATQAAKNLLKVTWSEAPGAHHDSERALEEFAAIGRDKSREGVPYDKVGDARAAMQSAVKVYRGEYRTRYLYHAQMEPMNATAAVSPDGKSVEIWTGTQGPTSLHNQVARLLATDRANITLHQHFLGGGYGRRSQVEVVLDAVRLSKAVGKPVKLIWTREDDVAGGKFRPMTAHHIEAGFDAAGRLIAWHHRVVAESVFAYTAIADGRPPAPNDRVVMKGSPLAQYPIPNKLAEHVVESRGARLAAFRGVGNAYNAFAAESFLDEIAKDRGLDPIAFRLTLSEGQPRMQTLLRAVAEMSDWPQRRDGRALGVGTMVKDDTLAAGVAEVSVDRLSGRIKVHNFWAAIDAGLAVQPRNIAAQTEGSIVYALGHVLREKITIRDGRVRESNYTDYEVTRMSDVPHIEVRVVSTDNPPTGAGEDGVPVTACAVGNAVAALTGVRLRELPFSPERVRGALGA
ncbi:MAG: xanthine dehydrogenase family protein molybdopterin-binding subunit [Bradyrhizobiaceae bacterium]|nr:xanthine dehydrogenase family protein molybdopterin-binding subunit [Bradyrhizobiaceae bacterium]